MQDNSLRRPRRIAPLGLPLALVSAAAFATSGVFGKALFQAGWTPAAAITARIGVAALVLGVPAALAMRGRWHLLRRNLRTVVLSGMTDVIPALAGIPHVFIQKPINPDAVTAVLEIEGRTMPAPAAIRAWEATASAAV